MEMRRHGAADSALSWITWNASIERLRRAGDPSQAMLLRYEDFVAHPRTAAIEAIVRMMGEAQAVLPFENDDTVRLTGNHTVSGNPSRFSTGTVALRSDDEWTRRQQFSDRAIVTSVALPLLRRYGYPLWPKAAQ